MLWMVIACTSGSEGEDSGGPTDPVKAPEISLRESGWGCTFEEGAAQTAFFGGAIYGDIDDDEVMVTLAWTGQGLGHEEVHPMSFTQVRGIGMDETVVEWDVVLAVVEEDPVPGQTTLFACTSTGDGSARYDWTHMMTATRDRATSCAVGGHDPTYFAAFGCLHYDD